MTETEGTRYVALLRGINVGGRAKIPMAELRDLCTKLGWRDVRSYIQSGNLVFTAHGSPDRLEADLEEGIQRRFGFSPSVMVRSGAEWRRYLAENPFSTESESEPNRVMLAVPKSPPQPTGGKLQERAAAGERVELVRDTLWIHFPHGAARSKLTPALLDRLVGSPVTMRNWRTVLQIADMLDPA